MGWIRKLILRLMVFAFRLLYHGMAWSYDMVAWVVSAGHWNGWVLHALTRIEGPAVLELGFGPGHLLAALASANAMQTWQIAGLDESRQMCRLARLKLQKAKGHKSEVRSSVNGYTQYADQPDVILARGLGEGMPFPGGRFNTVVATFPAPYIFSLATLGEIRRVLAPSGRLVILLSAEIRPRSLAQRASGWLFRVTGQNSEWVFDLAQRFAAAGLDAVPAWVDGPGARLLYITATLAAQPPQA